MGQRKWGWGCAVVLATAFATPLKGDDAGKATGPKESIASPRDARAAAVRRIEGVLDQPLRAPLSFVETPLNQVATVLAEDYDIPIQFDTKALDAVASSPEAEVTVDISNVTLRSALELLLRNAGDESLTYLIDKEVLLITTQEEAEMRPEVRVFRVDDLINSNTALGAVDLDSLVDIITSIVMHESWMVNGTGEGEIKPFQPGMLIISQTRRVQRQVEELLGDLRRTKEAVLADHASEGEASAQTPVTRGISLNQQALDKSDHAGFMLQEALQKSVDWKADVPNAEEATFLYVLPDRVLVRHLPHVVAQVENAVRQMELAPHLADAARSSEDGKQRPKRGGRGGGF